MKSEYVFEPGELLELKEDSKDFFLTEGFEHRRGLFVVIGISHSSPAIPVIDKDILYDVFWQEAQVYDKLCASRFQRT